MYPNYTNDRKLLGYHTTRLENSGSIKYKLYFFYIITKTVLPVVGPSWTVILPVPSQIVRVHADRNYFDSSEIKIKYGIAPSDIPSCDKIILSQSELNQVELIVKQYRLGLVTLDDVVLDLRGGSDSSNWILFFAFLYLLEHYTEGAFTIPPFMDPFEYIGKMTPKATGSNGYSAQCPNRYPFERLYMEGKKQTPPNYGLSMNDRYLQPHEVDKTLFENDKKFKKSYDTLITSNPKLEKKFQALEDKLSQGHFNSGREKGFQHWGKSKTICYIGSKGDGARVYYRFVPGEHKIEILAYSNKSKQTSITDRMVNLFDN